MASNSRQTYNKRRRKHANAGKDRKRRERTRSTLTPEELFAGCGEPGQPAPRIETPRA